METKMFVLGVFMLACIVQSGSALKCYTCDSISNPRCADVIENKGFQPQECVAERLIQQGTGFLGQLGFGNNNQEGVSLTCLKVVTRNNTGSVIARRCAVKYQNQDPCSLARNAIQQTGVNGANTQFEFCGACENKDGCNSGNSIQLFSSLIVFGAMLCTARLFV